MEEQKYVSQFKGNIKNILLRGTDLQFKYYVSFGQIIEALDFVYAVTTSFKEKKNIFYLSLMGNGIIHFIYL